MKSLKNTIRSIIKEQLELRNSFLSDDQINKVMDGYLFAIIFTEEENILRDADLEDTEDAELRFSVDDIDSDSVVKHYIEIKKFLKDAGEEAVMDYLTSEFGEVTDESLAHLGHDIWLTRNHHGAGFFDNVYENDETEEALINAAHKMGESNVYLGNRGKIYVD